MKVGFSGANDVKFRLCLQSSRSADGHVGGRFQEGKDRAVALSRSHFSILVRCPPGVCGPGEERGVPRLVALEKRVRGRFSEVSNICLAKLSISVDNTKSPTFVQQAFLFLRLVLGISVHKFRVRSTSLFIVMHEYYRMSTIF